MKIGMGNHGFEKQVRTVADKPQTITKKNDHAGTRIEETKQTTSDESSQKGVIRNLQEGHFKGVADLRLRTIFQADLELIQEEKDSALVKQSAAELTTVISEEFNTFVSGAQFEGQRLEAADDALAQFEAGVASVVADSSDPQVAVSELRSIVDSFFSSFGQEVTTSIGEEVAGGAGDGDGLPLDEAKPIDAEPHIEKGSEIDTGLNLEELPEVGDVSESTIEPEGEVDQLTELLNKLRGITEEIFSNLDTSLMESGLPEPTRPNNNGVAYDKFLAIYRANSVNDVVVPEPKQIDVSTESSANDNSLA